jgi:hypothetical protein
MPQSTICADTGNGATIAFAGATDLNSLKVRRISQPEQTLGTIDCSDLSTTGERSVILEDLTDPIEIEVEFIWDTFETPPVLGESLGVTTITYPTRTGETTPATRAAEARVSGVKHPDLANNELQIGMMKVQLLEAATYTEST